MRRATKVKMDNEHGEEGEWHIVRSRNKDKHQSEKMKTSYFFTNFPESSTESSLWTLFAPYGNVVDVYVARKRDSHGNRFGFVRFTDVEDIQGMETKLGTILIGSFKLRANLAKFKRNLAKLEGASVAIKPQNPKIINQTNGSIPNGCGTKSYANAILNSSTITSPNISLFTSPDRCSWLENLIIGETKSFQILQNIHHICEDEDFHNVKIRFMGGLRVHIVKKKGDVIYPKRTNSVQV
ncbi:RNA-directed DNA polymerase, eukaryota [Tanacetum coccineum]